MGTNKVKIAITDRNKNVRNLLHREFLKEGYEVLVITTYSEVCDIISNRLPCNVLVLDPEFSQDVAPGEFDFLRDNTAPVVVHTSFPDEWTNKVGKSITVVRKENIENLKEAVRKAVNIKGFEDGCS